MFGAIGDGITNDTYAFQKMMSFLEDNTSICYLTGDYCVDSIVLSKYCHLISNGGKLRKIPRYETNYAILTLQDNCIVEGLTLIGDRSENTSSGQWGHCIDVKGENCVIDHCILSEAHGDGIYIRNDSTIVRDCLIDHAYRNGISITNGIDFLVENTTIVNVIGNNPQYGIDIEPNTRFDRISGKIINVDIVDCVGGIQIFGNDEQTNPINIVCDDTRIYGTSENEALRFRNITYNGDEYCFTNVKIISPSLSSNHCIEFLFSGDNNPTISLECAIIGGKGPSAIQMTTHSPHCNNPISIKISFEGWESLSSAYSKVIEVNSVNPNISILCKNDFSKK